MAAAAVLAAGACGPGPLPPESPAIQAKERAATVPMLVRSSHDTPKPRARKVGGLEGIGLDRPSGVVYDPRRDVYWVLNRGGSAPGQGSFVSRLSPTEEASHVLHFSHGDTSPLQASGGIALSPDGATLAVTALADVQFFAAATGAALERLRIAGASRLSHAAYAPDGTLYLGEEGTVSEDASSRSALYRMRPEGVERLDLVRPDDVLRVASPGALCVTALGLHIVTAQGNALHRVSPEGQSLQAIALPSSELSGLVAISESEFIVSSTSAEALYLGGLAHGFQPLATHINAVHLGFDSTRRRVLLAEPEANRVQLLELSDAGPSTPQ